MHLRLSLLWLPLALNASAVAQVAPTAPSSSPSPAAAGMTAEPSPAAPTPRAEMPPPLTPPAARAPRVNGPNVFGVRPGSPFLYSIPATGERPMAFAVADLPAGLSLDAATGRITGKLTGAGEYKTTLRATNALGMAEKPFRIVVGEEIALTPPMGWNSWNCWHAEVDQDKVMRSARALVKFGLDRHGWTYVNIDDAWQGARGGKFNAIQPDPQRFPDMPKLAEEIHALGLKLGIYSTPWVTTYARRAGGSSENPEGTWDRATMTKGTRNKKMLPYAVAPHHFFANDAKQWAEWGVDYLKFDWAPIELPETKEMNEALRASGRDIVFSLSNNSPKTLFAVIPEIAPQANAWRISGDITDTWKSVQDHGFGQDEWAPYARPGHWNDPDMFEVGANGGGAPKRLTPDEQYTHVSLWCLVAAPLLLGCDLEHLDAFAVGLLSNDEVLEIDQDALGKQATCISRRDGCEVYAKPLEDGASAVGLFNRGEAEATVALEWGDLKISGKRRVRDLWRQKDLGVFEGRFEAPVAPHGVLLIRLSEVP